MDTSKGSTPTKWAVLIGINYYIPGDVRRPAFATSLHGCVNDIQLVEKYLLECQGFQPSCIRKLCAPHPPIQDIMDGSTKLAEGTERDAHTIEKPSTGIEGTDYTPHIPDKERPTYENIIRVLEDVTNEAQSGDFVYIHYSGHGGRAVTLIPDKKPGNPERPDRPGVDETLVPMDFNLGGRYLRDFEIATLLKRMVDKQLHVTLVFDSCHSGGATRGTGNPTPSAFRKRSISGVDENGIDWTILPSDKSDIPKAEVDAALDCQTSSHFKSWPVPNGYVLIAACLPLQEAQESGSNPQGLLTGCLVKALRSVSGNLTHEALHRRVRTLLQSMIAPELQTPVLLGNIGNLLFLNEKTEIVHNIVVSSVDAQRVRLEAGRAHGVCLGDLYGLYSWHASDDGDFSNPLAKVRVIIVSGTESDAKFESIRDEENVTVGCQAILEERDVSQAHIQLRLLCPPQPFLHLDLSSYSPGITILGDRQDVQEEHRVTPMCYYVSLGQEQRYELQNTENSVIPRLPPCNDPESLLAVAAQVGRFEYFRDLRNPVDSNLRVNFQPIPSETYRTSPGMAEILDGKSLTIIFENNETFPVYLTVFAFTSLWAIIQLFPLNADYEEIDWAYNCKIEIELELPEQTSSEPFIAETIKAFVTTKPTSFRSLKMAELTEGLAKAGVGRHRFSNSENQLQQQLATFDSPHSQTRSSISTKDFNEFLRPMRTKSVQSGTGETWQTREIVVHVFPSEI